MPHVTQHTPKVSGYLLLYEDTSAIDFGPDSPTRL